MFCFLTGGCSWLHHKTWAEAPRTVDIAKHKDASNVMFSKVVSKRKGVPDPKTGNTKWVIRMRYTLCAFEHKQAHLHEAYASPRAWWQVRQCAARAKSEI